MTEYPMVEYKGYIGMAECSDTDGLLYANVINTGQCGIADCFAADYETLKKEFRTSIDIYLDWCEEDGVEPTRPSSVNTLTFFPELKFYSRMALAALRAQNNIEDWLMDVIEREVAASEQEAAMRDREAAVS